MPVRTRPPQRSTRSSAGTAVAAVLAALVLGALLNGPGLVTAATGLDVGTTRTVAMRLATVIEGTGARLRLDRPQVWLTSLRDRGSELLSGGQPQDGAARSAATSTEGDPDAPQAPDARSTAPGSVREHDRVQRPVSAAQPLEVLLIGDSLIGAIADGFGRVTDERAEVRWTKDVRISTGLARPDVLDWPRHLEQQLALRDPDVVVLMLGGNDDQSLTQAPGGVLHLGDDGWAAEYERRVAELLAVAEAGDRLVIWLTLPAMRPDRLERTRPTMHAAAARALASTEVEVLDTAPLISPDGYAARLDGVQLRADDGVHLTHAGGDRVAEHLDALLRDRYDLPGG